MSFSIFFSVWLSLSGSLYLPISLSLCHSLSHSLCLYVSLSLSLALYLSLPLLTFPYLIKSCLFCNPNYFTNFLPGLGQGFSLSHIVA